VRQALLAIKTLSLEASVAQHFHDLGVFLAILLEYEFALLVVVFVLSTTPVLTTLFFFEKLVGRRETKSGVFKAYLSLILRHLETALAISRC
jgi:hypothetical protein